MDSDSQLDPSIRRADLLSPGAQPDSHLLLGKTWIPPYRNELYLNRAWSSNIFLHKAPPAKAEPEGEFAEERTCLNLKLLGEAYFMNIHEGGLAKSSVSVCELQQKVEEMQTGTVCVHNEAHWNARAITVPITNHFMNWTSGSFITVYADPYRSQIIDPAAFNCRLEDSFRPYSYLLQLILQPSQAK